MKKWIVTKEQQRVKPRAKLPPNRVEKDKSKYQRKEKHKHDRKESDSM